MKHKQKIIQSLVDSVLVYLTTLFQYHILFSVKWGWKMIGWWIGKNLEEGTHGHCKTQAQILWCWALWHQPLEMQEWSWTLTVTDIRTKQCKLEHQK